MFAVFWILVSLLLAYIGLVIVLAIFKGGWDLRKKPFKLLGWILLWGFVIWTISLWA